MEPLPFSRPLLATEHSDHDVGAERIALGLARRRGVPLAVVLPIASNPEYEAIAPQLAQRAEEAGAGKLHALEKVAAAEAVQVQVHLRRGLELFREIVDEAAALAADLIVVRRRGRVGLLANLLLGEMVTKVVAHAPCSVLIAPRTAQLWSRRVFAAVDPATGDVRPALEAAALARGCDLPLTIAAVAATREEALPVAERAAAAARSAGLDVQVEALALAGRVHEQLIAAAARCGADLIVVGRHGESALTRAWIGGVTQKVIGLAECPVLVSIPTATKEPA